MTTTPTRTPPTCFARSAMYRTKAAADAGDWQTAGREFQDCMRQFMEGLCEFFDVSPAGDSLPEILQALVDCPECCTDSEEHMRQAIEASERLLAGEADDDDDVGGFAMVTMFYVNDMLLQTAIDGELVLPEFGKPADWKWDHK